MEELDESLYTKVVFLSNGIGDEDNHYSKEFCYLLFAAFYQPVYFFKQNIDEINNSTYAGKGKLEEIRDLLKKNKYMILGEIQMDVKFNPSIIPNSTTEQL